MQISKQYLINLIKEEYNHYMFEQEQVQTSQSTQQSQSPNSKQVLKQNISHQVRILKFMRENLKTIKLPEEMQNMVSQIRQSKTPEFLSQVLQIPNNMTINISSVLYSPIELLQSIVDELIKTSIQKGNQKLSSQNLEEEKKEGDLPALAKDEWRRLEKHKLKNRKKHPETIPPPKL